MKKIQEQAIDILMSGLTTKQMQELVVRFAKKYPSALVKCFSGMATASSRELAIEICKSYMREGEKIKAIKHWREATGDGLRESKDFVESLSL